MKNYKIILLMIFGLFTVSCDLDEDPIFLDVSMYENPESASAAIDGIYQSLTTYNTQERRYFVVNGFSGFFTTGKNGNNNKNINNVNLFSLKPVYDADSEAVWGGLYQAIAQANSAIKNLKVAESPSTTSELQLADLAGHAYFLRAWCYFSLTRLFGDIPLWLELPSSSSLNQAKTASKDIYAQAINDAMMAKSLLNGSKGKGYPKVFAANMLLSKLYMTLATNVSLQADGISETEYWQKAYDEAIEVYRSANYSLVSNYSSLFTDSSENTSESIFELQISQDAANSQMGRNYSPWKWKKTLAFGWFKVHANIYDDHAATYPNDPRLEGTFISEWTRADNGKTAKFYPSNPSRSSYFNANPFFFKFAEKDQTSTTQYNSQNIVVYRYAELLIMLSEISNELQNGEEMIYVQQVLDRVGMTPHAGYNGSKEDFRDAIMREYRYELLGEGEDAHNNRRRGFNYFLVNVILKHNNNPGFKANVDLTLSTDESKVMQLPIPLIEVNTNELIDN
ncbi:MAG: RagB/SusD family nutrient uptake outer membrane protein [Flavobacteriaceae bacterium]